MKTIVAIILNDDAYLYSLNSQAEAEQFTETHSNGWHHIDDEAHIMLFPVDEIQSDEINQMTMPITPRDAFGLAEQSLPLV